MKRIFLTFLICLISLSVSAMHKHQSDAQYTIVCAQELKQRLDTVCQRFAVVENELKRKLGVAGFEQESPKNRTQLLQEVQDSSCAAQEVMHRWYYAPGNNAWTNDVRDYVVIAKAPVYRAFYTKFLSQINVFCGGVSALAVISHTFDQPCCVTKMSEDQVYLGLLGLLASIERLRSDSCGIIIALAEFCGGIKQYIPGK